MAASRHRGSLLAFVLRRAIQVSLLMSVGIVAGCLAFCSQPNVAIGASLTVAQARGLPFNAIAEDALVVKKLLAVENLIVADGARAIPTTGPLARRIEQRDELMERLCTAIIHDAAIVARAEQRARQGHITRRSDDGLSVTARFEIISRETLDAKTKLLDIERTEDVSNGDIVKMQVLMNRISQLSDLSSDLVSATTAAIKSMASNLKS